MDGQDCRAVGTQAAVNRKTEPGQRYAIRALLRQSGQVVCYGGRGGGGAGNPECKR